MEEAVDIYITRDKVRKCVFNLAVLIFQVTKPKSGVFCFLISEARETTALEMPDRENTFVLKAENNMEYVIEALDADDMKSWLTIIRYSMRAPLDGSAPAATSSEQAEGQDASVRLVANGSAGVINAPQLPPRHRLSDNPTHSLSTTSKEFFYVYTTNAVALDQVRRILLHCIMCRFGRERCRRGTLKCSSCIWYKFRKQRSFTHYKSVVTIR